MNLRALLIEDSESDAALILRQLKKSGYDVGGQVVQTADEMKAALSLQEWDVIIADYQLPEFDAPSALALLQESGLDIPFLVVSGAIGEETAVDLMRSGACDYLIKNKLARLGPAVERELTEANIRRQRKIANDALIESERNLQKSQSLAHIGNWISNFETGETIISDEIFLIFGIKPSHEFIDFKSAWKKYVTEPEKTWQLLAQLHPGEQVEFRITRSDGTDRYLLATAGEKPVDKSGRVTQNSGVIQDITERKSIELELLEKIAESQRRARELEIIGSVSSSLRKVQSRREMVDIILQELVQLTNAQFASLALLEKDQFCFEHAFGNFQSWQEQLVPADLKCFQQITATRKSMISIHRENVECRNELPDWLRENMPPDGMTLFCPLISGETMIGLIMLSFNQVVTISTEQMDLVTAITDIVGNAINRKLASDKLEGMVERREKELEFIYKITSAASSSSKIKEALQEALTLTLAAVQAEMGGIYLLDEDSRLPEQIIFHRAELEELEVFEQTFNPELILAIIREKRALLLPTREIQDPGTPARSETINTAVGLPMLMQGQINGVLAIRKTQGQQVNVEELTLLSFIADHLALVVENTRLIKKAEHTAILEERSRLARALHDSVTQQLYSAKLYSVGAQRFLAQNNIKEVEIYLDQISSLTQQALKDLRMMVYELRSLELASSGLLGALQHRLDAVEKRSGVEVTFQADNLSSLPEYMEENFFRIAMEALNNSLKHAMASNVKVKFSQPNDCVRLVIEDDGIGFDLLAVSSQGGMGLATMRERAEKMSGRFQIHSRPGDGTHIEIEVPFMINSIMERGSSN
jgi:signal transduction histidine kinase/CheY-like chemotaxis protein